MRHSQYAREIIRLLQETYSYSGLDATTVVALYGRRIREYHLNNVDVNSAAFRLQDSDSRMGA